MHQIKDEVINWSKQIQTINKQAAWKEIRFHSKNVQSLKRIKAIINVHVKTTASKDPRWAQVSQVQKSNSKFEMQ